MPSNQDSKDGNSSKYLGLLDKFRYKRTSTNINVDLQLSKVRPSSSNDTRTSSSTGNTYFNVNKESVYETMQISGSPEPGIIKGTPDHLQNHSSKREDIMPDSSQDDDTPVQAVRQKRAMILTDSDSDSESTKGIQASSPLPSNLDIKMIPETPEHLLNHSSKPDDNDTMHDSSQDSPIKAVYQKRTKKMILTDSESESESQSLKRVKTSNLQTNAERPLPPNLDKADASSPIKSKSETICARDNNKKYTAIQTASGPLRAEVFSGKEIGLQMMMKAFPKMDLMILQDTLAKCGWYAKKAIHILQENCDPFLCSHFKIPLFVPKVKPKTVPVSPLKCEPKIEPVSPKSDPNREEEFPKTIYIKADPDAPPLNTSLLEQVAAFPAVIAKESQNGSILEDHLEQISEPLLVPKLEPKDESEEGEEVAVNFKVMRRRIHQLSSDDSDDGFGKIQMISMATLPLATVKSEPTSVTRQDAHELSSDEGSDSVQHDAPADNSKNKEPERKKKKKKRKELEDCSEDDDYARDELYNSEDSDIDETLTPARDSVLTFYRTASNAELLALPGCSKKRVTAIEHCRPFTSWVDLVTKLQKSKHMTTDMLGAARDIIIMRDVMAKLMKRCEKISADMENVVAQLNSGCSRDACVTEQPSILTKNLRLAPYQMLGLNWLWVMHQNKLNGILADEMGLGKTIQAIAFLALIKQEARGGNKKKGSPPRRHLIIVPSSTMDNWVREFSIWCPSMNIITYHGSQEFRRELRLQIINREIEDFDAMVTTYNMVSSSIEDRTLFRRLTFHYVIFDEAHMLKNMNSQRYQSLMKVQAERRLLLTGTPLQNNLVELMSLLIFVMPGMFYGKVDQVKQMFSSACKSEENRSEYEKERIEHAKLIMKPFVLRRLKSEVLTQLPTKRDMIEHCTFTESQKELYSNLVETFSKRVSEEILQRSLKSSGIAMMMELRKAANHPLLLRKKFTNHILRIMSKKMIKEPTHVDASPELIFEDMQVMSDYELHRLCKNFKSVSSFQLTKEDILDSGKFRALDVILPDIKEKEGRLLLFSQFTMMLDIVEEYMAIRNYSFLRLDGSTPVSERQELMDRFNGNNIFAFLLSTKAGGLGINLTAANFVLLHDIDFNPYNDKQAEDRCHRMGQTREVIVKRMIMEDSIEEAILKCAQDKLKLEKDITAQGSEDKEEEVKTVSNLLKTALGI